MASETGKRPAPPAAPAADSGRQDAGGDNKLQSLPRSRVWGSADNCIITTPRARGAVGINLNNTGFLEQGKTNPVLTVKSSAITRTRNTGTVICGSTNIKSANKSA